MFELGDSSPHNANIIVVGIGGGGGNALEHMMQESFDGVGFVAANTDAQALSRSGARTILQLGEEMTKGLGAGSNPEVGRQAAEENEDRIREVLSGADMVFLTAGMGGGTGTGATPVFAKIAKEMNILTVAVVTRPFAFEGRKRMLIADEGVKLLGQYVDSLITIPNNKLLSVLGKNITLLNAFRAANNVLTGAVQGIADLITCPGLINVDFADVRTVMSEMGMAMMGTGSSVGENRAREAAEAAIASPLLEDVDFSGARGVLVNITSGPDMSIGEFEAVGDAIKAFASETATVVVGTVIDPDLSEELRVTVVITGLLDPAGANVALNAKQNNTRKDGTLDYHQLDRPAFQRYQQTPSEEQSEKSKQSCASSASVAPSSGSPAFESDAVKERNMDVLDIPSFLRRQDKTEAD